MPRWNPAPRSQGGPTFESDGLRADRIRSGGPPDAVASTGRDAIMTDQGTTATAAEAFSTDEATLRERLRWAIRLQLTVGALVFGRALLIRHLSPVPLVSGAVAAMVAVTLGGAALVAIVGRRSHGPALRVAFRRGLNFLTGVDTLLCVFNVHISGGANSFALPLIPLPLVVFGAFLRQRAAFAHAALASVLLGAVLVGEHVGLLGNVCLHMADIACGPPSARIAIARYVTIALMTFLASYVTAFVGKGLSDQEAGARRLADERGRLAELRARFVTSASHEFRTPLTVISAAADTLRRYGARMTDEQQGTRLLKIQRTVRQMTDLLDDVLAFGRADAGKLHCTPAPVDLELLCQEVIVEVAGAVGDRDRVRLRIVADGPHAPAVDRGLVRQILRNLLDNALKYSPDGGQVDLEVAHRDGSVRVRVGDQGIGIPPADQGHLFEPFHRAANVGEIGGSGLGMAITQRAVQAHGGRISVDSAVGRGTTVVVELPCGAPGGAAATPGQPGS